VTRVASGCIFICTAHALIPQSVRDAYRGKRSGRRERWASGGLIIGPMRARKQGALKRPLMFPRTDVGATCCAQCPSYCNGCQNPQACGSRNSEWVGVRLLRVVWARHVRPLSLEAVFRKQQLRKFLVLVCYSQSTEVLYCNRVELVLAELTVTRDTY
jgi:hypothetical protein